MNEITFYAVVDNDTKQFVSPSMPLGLAEKFASKWNSESQDNGGSNTQYGIAEVYTTQKAKP